MKFDNKEWERIGPCWDHSSGLRLHVSGAIRMPEGLGDFPSGVRSPERIDEYRIRYLTILWGCRRRAYMAFAIELLNDARRDRS